MNDADRFRALTDVISQIASHVLELNNVAAEAETLPVATPEMAEKGGDDE